jgi:hypothetical protein
VRGEEVICVWMAAECRCGGEWTPVTLSEARASFYRHELGLLVDETRERAERRRSVVVERALLTDGLRGRGTLAAVFFSNLN